MTIWHFLGKDNYLPTVANVYNMVKELEFYQNMESDT